MVSSRSWCVTLFCSTILLYAARVAMPMSVKWIGEKYDWSKTDSGIVLSCFFWGYVCMQAVAGHLADTYGGEHILAASVFCWSVLTFATPSIIHFAYTTQYAMQIIVLSRVLLGIAQGFQFPTIASIISRNLPPAERAPLFGVVMAGSHAGTVICGSFGSLMLGYYGWEFLFLFIGVAGIGWWVHFWYIFKPTLTERRREIMSHKNEDQVKLLGPHSKGDLEASTYSGDKRPSGSPTPLLLGVLLRKTAFWAAFCSHFCGANAYFTLFSWMPTYFEETFPDAKAWVFNFLPNLAIMTTSLIAPTLASRLITKGYSTTFVRKLMEGVAQIGVAVCLCFASTVTGYESALFFLSGAMALRGFHHGGVAVNPQDFAPDHTGAVFGLMNMASGIPGFIGVYTAGYILQTYHSWSYVFNFTSVVCLLGVLIYSTFGTAKQII